MFSDLVVAFLRKSSVYLASLEVGLQACENDAKGLPPDEYGFGKEVLSGIDMGAWMWLVQRMPVQLKTNQLVASVACPG